eukprot:jgi/Chlat1/1382/Chrsp12S02049
MATPEKPPGWGSHPDEKSHIFKFRAGALECAAIADMYAEFEPEDLFSIAPPDELARALQEQNILVDTGIGNDILQMGGGTLLTWLNCIGVSPEDISFIAITHAHPDHIGGVAHQGRLLFPNAKYVMSQAEWEFWTEASPQQTCPNHSREHQNRLVLVDKDMDIVPGFRALRLPGHTLGHTGFEFRSSKAPALVCVGDLALHPLHLTNPSWQRTESDAKESCRIRQQLLASIAEEGSLLHAFHFPFPSVGFLFPKSKGDVTDSFTFQLIEGDLPAYASFKQYELERTDSAAVPDSTK